MTEPLTDTPATLPSRDAPGQSLPPLLPALLAMMLLQAVVGVALFAPGVLAPGLGLSAGDVALFSTSCFAVGMAGALWGGEAIARLGAFGVAMACMAAVMVAMGFAALGSSLALVAGGLVLGLGFGPETPASSAILGKLVADARRPVIFSIRQTGNQIGGIIGSLSLPALAMLHPQLGYGAVIALAFVALILFGALRGRYDWLTRDAQPLDARGALRLMWDDASVRRLALASMPFSAMQLGLNAFLVSYLVGGLGFGHLMAGVLLGIAQAGGLVGRLAWGGVAARIGAAMPVLVALAIGMALVAGICVILPFDPPLLPTAALCFLWGLTASGWNGVFLAEVARQAPAGRVGEATGAVLTASYAGLVAGPLLISTLAALGNLRFSYAALAACCCLAGFALMRRT